MVTPALDLIIDVTDPQNSRLLSLYGEQVVRGIIPKRSRAVRNDGGQARVRCCTRNFSGNREYDDVDISNATVRIAIGSPDQIPSSGTYPLAPGDSQKGPPLVAGKRYLIYYYQTGDDFINVGAASNASGRMFIATGTTPSNWTHSSVLWEVTSDIAIDASAVAVSAALNATAAVTALGGVSVIQLQAGAYQVIFSGIFGARTAIAGPVNANLTPLSVISVSRVQAGTTTLHEVQLIRLIANPYCFATLSTPFPTAAAIVSAPLPATTDLPQTARLTINPPAYDGAVRFTLDGVHLQMAFNAEAAEVQALAGPNYLVTRSANQSWDFAGISPGQTIALSVDSVAALKVPLGVSGRMSLNTVGLYQAFAASTADSLLLTLELELQFPGEEPQTIYQGRVEIRRDVIDLNSLVPPTMLAIQFVASNVAGTPYVYTNTIKALRGGSSLEAVATTILTLDTRYEFLLGGSLNTWVIAANAADPADPNGQVAPLDYNISTNNKHWARAGGY